MPRKSFILEMDAWTKKKMMQNHRKNVLNARCLVDQKPSKMVATTFLKVDKLRDDFMASKRIHKANLNLLTKINYIQRNHGYTSNYSNCRGIKPTYLPKVIEGIHKIERENYCLGSKILKAKSSMNTRCGLKEWWAKHKKSTKSSLSEATITHYMGVANFPEKSLMEKLLRPKIFIDVYVKNIRPLGRIFIQLYTEACPELVLQFVRLCTNRSRQMWKFPRIFPMLWIEAELLVEDNSLSSSGFLYNMFCINHGIGPGVLSFAKCHLNGFPTGLLTFAISFKALPVLNGDRIPFGLITQGLNVLHCLQDFGTKNGKTKKDILVVNCGVLY